MKARRQGGRVGIEIVSGIQYMAPGECTVSGIKLLCCF